MNAFADESGVVAPLGYWDPAGFSESGDVEQFNRYRAIEIKHGRIAMLAMTHILVTHFFKLPGALSTSAGINFADVPSGLAALKVVPVAGWAQILLFQSALEILAPKTQRKHQEMYNLNLSEVLLSNVTMTQKSEKAPGDVQPESERGASFKRYD